MEPNVILERMGPDGKTVLGNLLSLYLHDFSEMVDIPIGPDGTFGYGMLDGYFTEGDKDAFLIKADGRPAGFVMLIHGLDGGDSHFMSEFFVLRGFRRRGVGREAALQAFKAFPGRWRVSEIRENDRAQAFWGTVIGEFTGGNYREEWVEDPDRVRLVQTFESMG